MYSTMKIGPKCDFHKNKHCLENTINLGTEEKDLNKKRNNSSQLLAQEKEKLLEIRKKFPTKVPVIMTRYVRENSLPYLKNSKFLVPEDLTMSQFHMILRNRLYLPPTKAFFILINERSMVSLSMTMAEAYKEFCQKDGYLIMTYASQETYGSSC